MTDRHLCSNFAWSGTDGNLDVYEFLLKKLGKPRLTVVLYAKPETIQKRLSGRDDHDPDLKKIRKSEGAYSKMRRFCIENGLNTLWIHTDKMNPGQIVGIILKRIGEMDPSGSDIFVEIESVEE